MNGYGSVLLNTTACSTWRGVSPGGPCYKVGENQPTRSTACMFVRYTALPAELRSHVTRSVAQVGTAI